MIPYIAHNHFSAIAVKLDYYDPLRMTVAGILVSGKKSLNIR